MAHRVRRRVRAPATVPVGGALRDHRGLAAGRGRDRLRRCCCVDPATRTCMIRQRVPPGEWRSATRADQRKHSPPGRTRTCDRRIRRPRVAAARWSRVSRPRPATLRVSAGHRPNLQVQSDLRWRTLTDRDPRRPEPVRSRAVHEYEHGTVPVGGALPAAGSFGVTSRRQLGAARRSRECPLAPGWDHRELAAVNDGRNLTPWRRVNVDPLVGHFGQSSVVVVAVGTRPRSRSLSR